MRMIAGNAAMLWAVVALLPGLPAVAEEESGDGPEYTEEQMLLFGTQHLKNVHSEAVLHYDFNQSGSSTREIQDRVALEITSVGEGGGKDLVTRFLSGENQRVYGGMKGFHSNPLIMYFLQWDVEKMERSSSVSHQYYRHLLRQAMRTGIRSEETTVNHGGRKLKGHKVFFQPLVDRKDDKKYASHRDKHYEFILTESIPGYIYSISTLIPGEKPDGEPLEHTRMTFNRLEPAGRKE